MHNISSTLGGYGGYSGGHGGYSGGHGYSPNHFGGHGYSGGFAPRAVYAAPSYFPPIIIGPVFSSRHHHH